MVNFAVVANNPKDPFNRRWLVSVDNQPPVEWPLVANFDGVSFIETHSQGEVMNLSLNLPNGKHVVYVAISAPASGEWGTYSGGVQMDGVTGEFSNVDVDTVASFEIDVKDNKAVKRVNQVEQELNPMTNTRMSAVSRGFSKLRAGISKHRWLAATIVGVGGLVTVVVVFLVLRKKRRRI